MRNSVFQQPVSLLVTLTFILFSATGCTNLDTNTASDSDHAIAQSPNDKRQYQHLILPNRLEVLLISSPQADKAAASLDVQVGSSDDPSDRQGLAHFLEHMLFLGTEKYPQAGDYQDFINSNGGSHNAFTSSEHTNYFFDVKPTALEPTLDRFAQFFTAPLFNVEYVDREKNAVNAEYQSKLKDDGRRQYDVFKALINPDHPLAKFSVGSLQTLAERDEGNPPLRDDLLRFYRTHYSANQMKLVVIGNQSLAQLKAMVVPRFSQIPDYNKQTGHITEPLFKPGVLPLRVNINPVKDRRSLILQFPIPSPTRYYLEKPLHYIANLLGDEGPGSLLSHLKAMGWVETLSAGPGIGGRDYATFQVTMSLTREGLKHTTEISQQVFAAIKLIKQRGIEDWRFDEQSKLSTLAFRFKEEGANINYALSLAGRMHDYPITDLLRAPFAMDVFEPKRILEYLDDLTPDNMLMTVIGKSLPTDRSTRWFNTPYSVQPITPELADRLTSATGSELKLPPANPFIPDNLAIAAATDDDREQAKNHPAKVLDRRNFTLWHKLDTSFNTPRANFNFAIRSPLANNSARNAILTQLYVKVVNEQLNEFTYPAYLAGLNYQLYKHVRGLSVKISGYNDKQDRLLREIVRVVTNPLSSAEKFARYKDELTRALKNTYQDRPYNQAVGWVSKLILSPNWTEQELLAELETIDYRELSEFIPAFLENVEMVALANGNITEEKAHQMAQKLIAALVEGKPATAVPRLPVVRLDDGRERLYSFSVKHPDSALTSYFQGPDRSIPTRASFALLSQIIATPYYQQLRTQQQLGYIVFARPFSLLEVPAIAFVVQSPNTAAQVLEQHTQNFIRQYEKTLSQMDDQALTQHKQALITKIMERDTQLSKRSERYWHEIDRSNDQFDSREQLVAAINRITPQQLIADYRRYLLNDSSRRLLNIYAVGENHPGEPAQRSALLRDDKALQRSGKYF